MRTHTRREEQLILFVCINAIIQLFLDIILEIFGVIPVLRFDHISLTFLNAFLSYKTLTAIYKDLFRFLQEDCQTLFLLELLLIFGDIFHLIYEGWNSTFFYIRIFFVSLSLFNLIFITFVIIKYNLYHLSYQEETDDEEEEDVELGIPRSMTI